MRLFRYRKLKKEEEAAGLEADEPAGEPDPDENVFVEVEEPPGGPGATGDMESGFFDLDPEAVATWKPPGIDSSKPRFQYVKPLSIAFAVFVFLGALITVLVLFWPTSSAEVPDVIGKTLSEAKAAAGARGFSAEVVEWRYSYDHSEGVVLGQEPEGNVAKPKGSKLFLTLSKGPEPEPEIISPVEIDSQSGDDTGEASIWPLSGKTICIDPAHQGLPRSNTDEWVDPGMTERKYQEPGTRGEATGNPEHLLTLDIAMKLKDLLEKDGLNVVLTRDSSDVDLSNTTRAEVANDAEADLFLRICTGDSENSSESGTRVLYPEKNDWTEDFYEKSKTAALYVQSEIVKSCSTADLGTEAQDGNTAFNWSKVPAIEAEVAFLSNPDDDRLLYREDFRWKVAWGLRNGIIKYLNSP